MHPRKKCEIFLLPLRKNLLSDFSQKPCSANRMVFLLKTRSVLLWCFQNIQHIDKQKKTFYTFFRDNFQWEYTMTPEKRASSFLLTRKTLILATTSEDATPTASYAPFVRQATSLYVYLSALSRHTKDLIETRKASALLLEDEHSAENLFARKRITFTCSAKTTERGCDEWRATMTLFGNTFGNIFDIIRPLRDFTLFRLDPYEAIYVEGFGKAYRMTPDLRDPVHIKGTGPGAKAK
jgi:heme iron utilization protein